MKCKLTGSEGKGIKAHLIPKAFYSLDYSDPIPLQALSSNPLVPPKKSMQGIYDATIVTQEGERIFSPCDDYACNLLLNQRNTFQVRGDSEEEEIFLEKEEYDYTKLKLFFLSILWRASVSSQQFFAKVSLGPRHEEVVRNALLVQDAGDAQYYSVMLTAFKNIPSYGLATRSPLKHRMEDIVYYRLYLDKYIAHIKVDQRPAPYRFNPVLIKPNSSLRIPCREFKESREFHELADIAKHN